MAVVPLPACGEPAKERNRGPKAPRPPDGGRPPRSGRRPGSGAAIILVAPDGGSAGSPGGPPVLGGAGLFLQFADTVAPHCRIW
jgi:hypothetical protein